MIRVLSVLLFAPLAPGTSALLAQDNPRIIIADAFSDRDDVRLDWGFAALVAYGGKRILFDAGNDAGGGIVGGLHLVTTPEAEIDRLVEALRNE